MATFTNLWTETIPEDNLLSGLSEAGKIDDLIRQLRLDIRERILKYCPIGLKVKWSSDIVPPGFMECDGASLLRADYPLLFGVIGTIYGTADGTHFNLPDHRGYFTRGWNHGKASGLYDPDATTRTASTKAGSTMSAGDHVGTFEIGAFKLHSHLYYSPVIGASGIFGLLPLNYVNYQTSQTDDSTGEDESRPKNISQKYIIRVDGMDSDDYYVRTWFENEPTDADRMGLMALELRKFKNDVEERIFNFFTPGMVIFWPSMILPDGYKECDGSFIAISAAPDLYDMLGDIYGPSDGTNFYLPDLRGYFLRAQDSGAGCDLGTRTDRGDGLSGDYVGTKQNDSIEHHHHSYVEPFYVYPALGFPPFLVSNQLVSSSAKENVDNSPIRAVDGHPKNIYLMPIIRTAAI